MCKVHVGLEEMRRTWTRVVSRVTGTMMTSTRSTCPFTDQLHTDRHILTVAVVGGLLAYNREEVGLTIKRSVVGSTPGASSAVLDHTVLPATRHR